MASSKFALLEERNRSLQNWPLRSIFADVSKHAKAGFYFDDESLDPMSLVCVSCNLIITYWATGDDPITKHVLTGPCCQNIVLLVGMDYIEHILRDNGKLLVKLKRWLREQLNRPIDVSFQSSSGQPGYNDILIQRTVRYKPMLLNLQEPSCRQNTMEVSNVALPGDQKATLAKAGFCIKDGVCVCFYCKETLPDYLNTKDAWKTHVLLNPNCLFVLIRKGSIYVDEVFQSCNVNGSNITGACVSSGNMTRTHAEDQTSVTEEEREVARKEDESSAHQETGLPFHSDICEKCQLVSLSVFLLLCCGKSICSIQSTRDQPCPACGV